MPSSRSSSDVSSKGKHESASKTEKKKNVHRRHEQQRRKNTHLLKSFNKYINWDDSSSSSSSRSNSISDSDSKTRQNSRSKTVIPNNNNKKRRSRRKVAAAAQDQAEQMDVSDLDIIDLRTPINEISVEQQQQRLLEQPVMTVTRNHLAQLSLTMQQQQAKPRTPPTGGRTPYTSRTLSYKSGGRYLILPAFPTSVDNDHCPDLLLANIPDHLLSDEERNRRRSPTYRPPFHIVGTPPNNILSNSEISSFFWPIYQELFANVSELFANVSEHLHIDMAIIDYNYARLSRCIDIRSKERIFRFRKAANEVTLDQREYPIALEFYLQIDVDLFYMKTCSFRHVQPLESPQYLFCHSVPVACHEMIGCGNCGLCYPRYDVDKRRQPAVDFGLATRRYQFVNKYESILNCPCSCNTSNIIYVLTCPCGQFDYIGETSAALADRIASHRFHGNGIMHETFLGPENIKLAHPDLVKSAETLAKDDMYLYRHSTQCPAAIQMFLDVNPRYWRSVPMTNEEANQPEQSFLLSTVDIKFTDIQDDNKIRLFIQNLPAPPPHYRFSTRQYHLQYAFFKSRRYLEMPNQYLDLYNAKIIAVLPETGSIVLRQIIEALFITHTEAKLNSSGRLVTNIDSHDAGSCRSNDGDSIPNRHQEAAAGWCQGLVRRPLTSVVKATEPPPSAVATTTTTT